MSHWLKAPKQTPTGFHYIGSTNKEPWGRLSTIFQEDGSWSYMSITRHLFHFKLCKMAVLTFPTKKFRMDHIHIRIVCPFPWSVGVHSTSNVQVKFTAKLRTIIWKAIYARLWVKVQSYYWCRKTLTKLLRGVTIGLLSIENKRPSYYALRFNATCKFATAARCLFNVCRWTLVLHRMLLQSSGYTDT